jgi:hypothetical protein
MTEVAHTLDSQLLVAGVVAVANDTVSIRRFMTWGVVGCQITGTWTGTVTFEGTIDGTNWVAQSVTPSAGGAAVTAATANGIFANANNSLAGFRARLSTATSGSAVVTIKSLPSQF